MIVQRYVEGPRHNVYFAAGHGRILAAVETMILRTDRPDGTGFAVEGVTVAPDARLHLYSETLIASLGYSGIGCIQYLVPPRGEPHFLELNPRHGAAMAIARHCGLDLTLAAIDLAARGDWRPDPVHRYPVGRRYAWTSGDLNAWRLAAAGGSIGNRETLRWLLRSLVGALRADVHLTWSLRDPLPTLAAYANQLPVGRLRRRIRPTAPSGSRRQPAGDPAR
jgi:ATP-grasp in the biosynthetic pathway with Ter operon